VAAAANEFKVASSDWATLNCGSGAAGDTVTVGRRSPGLWRRHGQPQAHAAKAGTYTFTFKRIDGASGEVTVTGP